VRNLPPRLLLALWIDSGRDTTSAGNLSPVIKPMPADRFLDTNILLYGYDLDAPAKRLVAQSLIEQAWLQPGRTAISVQVLQEFHVNFVRYGHSAAEATALVGDFSLWTVVDNSLALLRLGLSMQARWQLSLWDSMILAAAQSSGARELLTEDLNHGQDYGGVRVIDPFLPAT
jgi:predicted nucleic acid-binding protein